VAGLDAGMTYNTWPLMDGRFWPDNLLSMQPAWENFLENPKTVQFMHRMIAYVLLAAALWHAIAAARSDGAQSTHARRAALLVVFVMVQAALGIVTLLGQVPLAWALAHQAMALIVLGFVTAHWRACKGSYAVVEAAPEPAAWGR